MTADEDDIVRFADYHFERHKHTRTRWNGRQIRNAFQTASAMAEYEALEKAGKEMAWESQLHSSMPVHLTVTHFRIVADASSEFDSYIKETIGGTDAERALMDRERADHFQWAATFGANRVYAESTFSKPPASEHGFYPKNEEGKYEQPNAYPPRSKYHPHQHGHTLARATGTNTRRLPLGCQNRRSPGHHMITTAIIKLKTSILVENDSRRLLRSIQRDTKPSSNVRILRRRRRWRKPAQVHILTHSDI